MRGQAFECLLYRGEDAGKGKRVEKEI